MKRPPVIVVQFIHIQGPMKGEIQEFTEDFITIGRHPSCLLRFPPDLAVVSRNHAEIAREGNRFKLVDHSTNGTFVNGKRITEAFLKGGDVLEFSEGGPKVSFLTEMREGVAPAAPEPAPPPPPRPQAPVPPPPRAAEPIAPPPPRRPPVPSFEPPAAPRQPPGERPAPPPVSRVPSEIPTAPVKVPLIIQYGPTLKSYREVPVTIGRGPRCQFAIDHPALLDGHAQILFHNDQYWVKDLTGQRLVEINRQPVGVQAPLSVGDELALTPKGPVFKFLGQGRLAEVSQPEAAGPAGPASQDTPPKGVPGGKDAKGGVLSRFRKLID